MLDADFFAKLKEVASVMRSDRVTYALERLPLVQAKLAGYQNRRWPEQERLPLGTSIADSILVLMEVASSQGMMGEVVKEMGKFLEVHEGRAVKVVEQANRQ